MTTNPTPLAFSDDMPQDMEAPEGVTPPEGEPVTDLLVNMFIRQAGHKLKYDEIYRARGLDPVAQGNWGNLNDPRLQLELRTTAAYLLEELFEAINLLKNKPWKQTPTATDVNEFYKELADAWHFWLEFMILAGMTPDVIAKYYFQIAESNDNRRAEGY